MCPVTTSKTPEGRSATFRVQGLGFFFLFFKVFWPQLLHDFLQHFLKIYEPSREGVGRRYPPPEASFSFSFFDVFDFSLFFFDGFDVLFFLFFYFFDFKKMSFLFDFFFFHFFVPAKKRKI